MAVQSASHFCVYFYFKKRERERKLALETLHVEFVSVVVSCLSRGFTYLTKCKLRVDLDRGIVLVFLFIGKTKVSLEQMCMRIFISVFAERQRRKLFKDERVTGNQCGNYREMKLNLEQTYCEDTGLRFL